MNNETKFSKPCRGIEGRSLSQREGVSSRRIIRRGLQRADPDQVVPPFRRPDAAAIARARPQVVVVRAAARRQAGGVLVLVDLVGGADASAALAAEQARPSPEEAPGPGADAGRAGDLVGLREAGFVNGEEGDDSLLPDLLAVLGADAGRVPRGGAQVQRVAAVAAAVGDVLDGGVAAVERVGPHH